MAFRFFTILAVIALAVSTWILSSPARRPRSAAASTQSETPGYYLKHTTLTDYDVNGAPQIRIAAERIDQIPQTEEVALSNVRVDYTAANGQPWVMFGDRAHIRPGGKIIDVNGNVRLQGVAPPPSAAAKPNGKAGTSKSAVLVPTIRTESLSYDVPNAVATTAADVRIEFGSHYLNAHGLVANLKDRTMRLESKVNGRFQP